MVKINLFEESKEDLAAIKARADYNNARKKWHKDQSGPYPNRPDAYKFTKASELLANLFVYASVGAHEVDRKEKRLEHMFREGADIYIQNGGTVEEFEKSLNVHPDKDWAMKLMLEEPKGISENIASYFAKRRNKDDDTVMKPFMDVAIGIGGITAPSAQADARMREHLRQLEKKSGFSGGIKKP